MAERKITLYFIGEVLPDSLKEYINNKGIILKEFPVNSWNSELSPWPYPEFKNRESFEGKGYILLDKIIKETEKDKDGEIWIGGYSLAGLFSLWAAVKTNLFQGVLSCSSSFWYKDFAEYVRENPFKEDIRIYMSLGDKEKKAKNKIMSTVEDKTLQIYEILKNEEKVKECFFEFNEGNHFTDFEGRIVKAVKFI